MKNLKQRITAILLAMIQMLTLVAPGSFALAEGETITSDGIDQIGDSYIYYTPVQADSGILAELGENGYQVIVEQDNAGTVSYASKPISQIVSSGFEGFGEEKAPFVTNDGIVDADSGAEYNIKIAQSAETNYESLNDAFNNTDTNDLEGGKFNWTFSAKKGLRIAATPSVYIDFFEKDGRTPDNNAQLNGTYYLVVSYGYNDPDSHIWIIVDRMYAPISISGSQAVISQFILHTGAEPKPLPDSISALQDLAIVKYTGDESELLDAINSDRWYYDPYGQLTKVVETTNDDLEIYKITDFDKNIKADQNYHIKAQKNDIFVATIKTYDSTAKVANTEQMTQEDVDGWEQDNKNLVPDPPISGDYYLRAHISNSETGEKAWTLVKFNYESGSDTTQIPLNRFVPENVDGTSNNNVITYNTSAWDLDDIYVITPNSNDPNNVNLFKQSYENACNRSYIDTKAPEGYAWLGNMTTEDGCLIALKKDNDKAYHVQLKFEANDPALVSFMYGEHYNEDYSVKLRVTLEHKNSSPTYYTIELTPALLADEDHVTEKDGWLYLDIPINTWYNDEACTNPSSDHFTGGEKQHKIEIIATPKPSGNPIIIQTGQYLNAFMVTNATKTDNVDRFEYERTPEHPDYNANKPTSDVYDVVTFSLNRDQIDVYSLDTLMNHYNIVTLCPNDKLGEKGQGDFDDNNHVIGGILVRGDLFKPGNSMDIGSGDAATMPSVIGGKVADTVPLGIFQGGYNGSPRYVPLYISSENQVAGPIFNGHQGSDGKGYVGKYGETLVSDTVVDWDRLRDYIDNQSRIMQSVSTPKDIATLDEALVYDGNTFLPIDSKVLYVTAGEKIKIDGSIDGVTVIIKGDENTTWSEAAGTVITLLGDDTVYVPTVYLQAGESMPITPKKANENEGGDYENAKGLSLVYNCPEAKTVIVDGGTSGHVIAPNADIQVGLRKNGEFNGTMIGNQVETGGDSEAHMWPYKGGDLISANVTFNGFKNLDTQASEKQFAFVMQKFDEDEASTGDGWENNPTVAFNKSSGTSKGLIQFMSLTFDEANKTYYYKIYEDPNQNITGYSLDETEYLVKIEVGSTDANGNTQLTSNITYYKLLDENGLVAYDPENNKWVINKNLLDDATKVYQIGFSNANHGPASQGFITFANTTKRAGLTVQKSVVSPVAADKSATYTFKVLLKDAEDKLLTTGEYSVTGQDAKVTPDSEGKVTITITGSGSKTITGLPEGTKYEVTEVSSTGGLDQFTISYTNKSGTVDEDGETVTVTNTREVGEEKNGVDLNLLKVKKETDNTEAAASGVKFTLTEVLPSGSTKTPINIEKTTGTDGKATFTLTGEDLGTYSAAGETKTFTLTEDTETKPLGYSSKSPWTVTVESQDITHKNDPTTNADVTVYSWAITEVKDSEGTKLTASSLTYKIVNERDTDIEKNGVDLKILKVTDGENEDEAAAEGVKFTLADDGAISIEEITDNEGKATLTLSGDQLGTYTAAGEKKTFTLTEDTTTTPKGYSSKSPWTVTVESQDITHKNDPTTNADVTVYSWAITEVKDSEGTKLTASSLTYKIVNERNVGDLEVSKTVVNKIDADDQQKFLFTIELNSDKINGKHGDMTFDKGIATVELKGGESAKASGLPIGINYKVTEAVDERYEAQKTGDTGTIEEAGCVAAFTNTRKTGDLKVSKEVVSDAAADAEQKFTFTIKLNDETISGTYGDMTFEKGIATVELKGGESAAAKGLPTGIDYTVTEAVDESFEVTKTGDTGTIIEAGCEAAFTNTRKTGDLKVSKTVVSDAAADAEQEFEFTIELSDKTISGTYGDMTFEKGIATVELKGGESATATGLPTGIDYTVTEAVDENFEVKKTGDTGTIVEAGCEAAFTNTRKTGDLEVSKEVVSDAAADADQKFTFTIELSDKTISGTYGDMTFEKGIATVELKGGESATATGLPTGIDYTVTEAVDENFEVTKTGDTGTIDEAGCEAAFTNTRMTGDLEISKTVVSFIAADADQKFTFTIELSDKTISGTYGDMTFEKGIATVELKGGESATAEGLPTGIDYQVTEATEEAFNTEKTGDTGTIDEAGCTAAFTNTRKTANVKVSKVDVASGEELEGATIQILRKATEEDAADEKTKYADETKTLVIVEEWVSSDEAHEIKGLLTDTEYTLRETVAPDGYTVTVDTTFTIDETGKVTSTGTVSEDGVLLVEDAMTRIRVSKVDAANGEELEGATIQILRKATEEDAADKNTKYADEAKTLVIVEEWVSETEAHVVEGLLTDTEYILRETVAPHGYDVTTDTMFIIDETGKVTSTGTISEDGVLLVEDDMFLVCAAVKKVWDDEENRDGRRPLKVTVDLLANGTVVRTIDLTAENHWMAVADKLPMVDKALKTIEYTWAEHEPGNGYKLTGNVKNGTLTTLTNSRDVELTEVSVQKKWNDNGNAANMRPDKIRVQLYADGEACGEEVVLNAGNGWKYTWTGLKKNCDKTAIAYTVEELEVPEGYQVSKSGSAAAGYVLTNTLETGSLVIRKTFDIEEIEPEEEPETELIDINVRKVWDDNNNQDGTRPASITVHLLAGGETIETVQLTEAAGWRHTFRDLPRTVRGNRITYSVTEDPVPGYSTEVHGYTIRNTYRPEETSVTVRKVWNDNNNALGIRPTSIRMRLNNGTNVLLSEANGWQATVTGLPKKANGVDITYTWTEQEVVGYKVTSRTVQGSVTTFTNKPLDNPELPEGFKPKVPSGNWERFEEYETPLGVESLINHVGDCFD